MLQTSGRAHSAGTATGCTGAFLPDFAGGTSSPNSRAAVSPRMLRLDCSSRKGSFGIEPLHDEWNPSEAALDPDHLELGEALGNAVEHPIGHVNHVEMRERQGV